MCLSPITLKTEQKDRFGKHTRQVHVNCRKCSECIILQRRQWLFRFQQELYRSPNCLFVTLTYQEDTVKRTSTGIPTFRYRDLKVFWKAIRRDMDKMSIEQPLRYFVCSEYGGKTYRPHYHAIVFNCPEDLLYKHWHKKKGFITLRPADATNMYYTLKYMGKRESKNLIEKERQFLSQYPHITEKEIENILEEILPETRNMSTQIGMNWLTEKRKREIRQGKHDQVSLQSNKQITLPECYLTFLSNLEKHIRIDRIKARHLKDSIDNWKLDIARQDGDMNKATYLETEQEIRQQNSNEISWQRELKEKRDLKVRIHSPLNKKQ